MNLKEISKREELLVSGHRACAGCCEPIIIRQILLACSDYKIVVSCATGCLEVTTTIFPYTSWKIPFIHSAFENSAATIAGVEAGYKALLKKKKAPEDVKFIGIGGDGGTYDIGFQALSGAFERNHDIVYVCLDNQAYMNTGIQRSSATPIFAHTTTSPAGKEIPGKIQQRKDITFALASHGRGYIAQAVPSNFKDLMNKAKKAVEFKGPAFINVLSPCRLGWGYPPEDSIDIAKEAVDTCFWPLYEIEDGILNLNYKPKEKKPILPWLKRQARFMHLFKTKNSEELIKKIQEEIDRKWELLLSLDKKRIAG